MYKGIVAVLFSLLFSGVAQAYDWMRCSPTAAPLIWRPSISLLQINTASFPAGNALRSKLITAAGKWGSSQSGANFNFVMTDRSATPKYRDGYNDVYFANLGDGVLATTYLDYDCSNTSNQWKIRETDIVFTNKAVFSAADEGVLGYWMFPRRTADTNRPIFNFEMVAMHELGHALGLIHENRRHAIMNAFYPNGGPQSHTGYLFPHRDDIEGIRYLYGPARTIVDVAAFGFTAYTTTGTNNDADLSIWPLNDSVALVQQGWGIELTAGVQNLGLLPVTNVRIQWYLSTDDKITTSDIPLGQGSTISTLSTWVRHTSTVGIPQNTTPGNYWIGFIVDPYNQITELRENNNALAVTQVYVTTRSSGLF